MHLLAFLGVQDLDGAIRFACAAVIGCLVFYGFY